MTSYPRRHHGRPRPPPARNRPGHHASSHTATSDVDPMYLAFLRSQAVQLDSQISALSGLHRVSPNPTYSQSQASTSTTTHSRQSTRRNPAREGSKWRFYAVKNGLEGDDVYSSWHQAYPYCWDPATQYFFKGCFCKGFDDYNTAWNFLLGLSETEHNEPSYPSGVPLEPPEVHIPQEPPNINHVPPDPTMIHPDPVYPPSQERDGNDDDSLTTIDFTKILKPGYQHPVPHKVEVNDVATTSTSTESNGATPFLSAASHKALPKYAGKTTDDINEFIYKLRPFLQHPLIDKCHLDASTDSTNAKQSKFLAALLSMCISGHALSPFIDNPFYDDKGIEMLHHLMDLKHPISKSSATSIYHSLSLQKIGPKESFDSFAKRLRLMYKTCTRSGIKYEESFLVCCFVKGLDSNFDYAREMLDVGAFNWYEKTLNDIIVICNDIKLTKTSNGTWTTDVGTANASQGKQGAKRPDSTDIVPEDSTAPVDADIPAYLSKTSELTFKEVRMLLERYACPLCRKNNHAFHTCHAIKNTYDISLRRDGNSRDSNSGTANPTRQGSTSSTGNSIHTPVTANRVSTVQVLPDVADRYDGFESVAIPPADSDSDDATDEITNVQESLNMSKLNDSSDSYPFSSHNFFNHVGSIRQANVNISPHAFRLSPTANKEYPIIIDSGATHHMWADASAFKSFTKMDNCYVTLANNHKIPTLGRGTIQLLIDGYILQLHDAYHVPALQFSLYSVKQHRRYISCSCVFDNKSASFNFPKFQFTINDDFDMMIYGRSNPVTSTKIHWSSLDGTKLSHRHVSKSPEPVSMPSHKPNPNKQHHRKITNIDIHKYMGFRTLKNLKPFQIVSQDTVQLVNAGEIPLNHGDVSTVHRHTSNKNPVERP